MQARETYTYGNGRTSYLNHQMGDSYQYLTNQSGSVTGLTKNGQAVASSSYHPYGSTKTTTDETGNPFAYNGEARDVTGLDYLRARYYDSQVGTFLTEDSYSGELTDPLSQNLYSYVQNNPVNYTDPSGHFWKSLVKGAKKLYNGAKQYASNTWNKAKNFISNTWNTTKKAAKNVWNNVKSFATNTWNSAKQLVNNVWNSITSTAKAMYNMAKSFYHSASNFVVQQYNNAKRTITNAWEQAKALGKSVYNWGKSKAKEALNIGQNWSKSLEEAVRHVCEVASYANGGKVYASTVKFNSNTTTVANDFKQNLQNQYGFEILSIIMCKHSSRVEEC